MNKEKKIIEAISKIFPRSPQQINKLFEADSEILQWGNEKMLINIDGFSEEDYFRIHDPYSLGWNIAVGSISDILASGGTPLYFGHSLVIGENWDSLFLKKFTNGIKDVLTKYDTFFIGGDFGSSNSWNYTAMVIGVAKQNILLRSSAKVGDSIYISGKVGAGNLEAALKIYQENKKYKSIIKKIKNRFKIRKKEAALILKFSECCIDTSDGVFNAIKSISKMSKTGFELENIPYHKLGVLASKTISLPKTLLLLGESGEYELLFTLSKSREPDFIFQAKQEGLKFFKIGEIADEINMILKEKNKIIDLSNFNIWARNYNDINEYINNLAKFATRQ